MKRTMAIVFALAFLLAAGTAHAYAVYSHVDKKVCVLDRAEYVFGGCKFWIDPDGHHNGAHGSGLKGYKAIWWVGTDKCRGSDYFDIPDGGYAKIYNDKIDIYKHDNQHVGTKSVGSCSCPVPFPGGKK